MNGGSPSPTLTLIGVTTVCFIRQREGKGVSVSALLLSDFCEAVTARSVAKLSFPSNPNVVARNARAESDRRDGAAGKKEEEAGITGRTTVCRSQAHDVKANPVTALSHPLDN